MSEPRKSRHRDLAELSSLLAFRNHLNVANSNDPPTPVKTNWRLTPANDNRKPAEGFGNEQAFEIIPSLDAIEREMVSTDIEYGEHIDDDGKHHKVIVRIGSLRFSNGKNVEKGEKLAMGNVVTTSIRMPVGAMLHTRERATREKGSVADPVDVSASHRYFAGKKTDGHPAGLFQARRSRPVTKKQTKPVERVEITKAEARQILAEAMTRSLVPVTKCPDGFPAGPKNLAHLFPGLVKVSTGSSGSQAWEDIHSEGRDRQEFHHWLQTMKDDHVEILTAATSAKNLAELGQLRGYSGKYAIAAGRRLLVAANDNFEEARRLAGAI